MRLPLMMRLIVVLGVSIVAGCSTAPPLDAPLEDLGTFRLGHNIVVAQNAQLAPLSREASAEEWEASLTGAIAARMGRYDGDGLFHLGVSVDGYALAVPGVPLVVSPKSVLIISVNIWDNRTQKKLTEEPEQLTVFESLSGETVVGSGLTQTKEQQMENLSRNAAAAIERWLAENSEWFVDPGDGTPRVEFTPAPS